MTTTDLVDRLAEHKTLGAAPREERAWLASRGTLRHLDEGDVMSAKGVPVEGFFGILTGRVAIFVDRGAGRHKVMEWPAGDVSGVLPYSRLLNAPGDAIAQEPSEILAIPKADLPAMIHECHEITSILVHKMLDRARLFTSRRAPGSSAPAGSSRRATCTTRRWSRSESCPRDSLMS